MHAPPPCWRSCFSLQLTDLSHKTTKTKKEKDGLVCWSRRATAHSSATYVYYDLFVVRIGYIYSFQYPKSITIINYLLSISFDLLFSSNHIVQKLPFTPIGPLGNFAGRAWVWVGESRACMHFRAHFDSPNRAAARKEDRAAYEGGNPRTPALPRSLASPVPLFATPSPSCSSLAQPDPRCPWSDGCQQSVHACTSSRRTSSRRHGKQAPRI